MGGSLTVGHVRGIPVRAHFTLLVIVPYLAFLMAARFAEVATQAGVQRSAMLLPPPAWGLVLALVLFGCVLAHELGHSLVAQRAGGQVLSITLMLLGGVSELHGLPQRPAVEARVAVAGPLVSLSLGALGLGLHAVVHAPPDVRFGLFYLGQINLVLGVFNLLPAFPMDGGRVLRALLELRLPRVKATRIAAGAGVTFAALFVLVGLLGGNFVLALIGVFIWTGARAESDQVQREELLRGLRVGDVMNPAHDPIEGWRPATDAAWRMAALHATALPVTEGGRLVGVVALHHLEALAPAARETTPVAAVTGREAPWLQLDEPLAGALVRMAAGRATEALVLDGLALAGVLEPSDLARTLRLRQLARVPPARPPLLPERPPVEEGPTIHRGRLT